MYTVFLLVFILVLQGYCRVSIDVNVCPGLLCLTIELCVGHVGDSLLATSLSNYLSISLFVER